KALEMFERSGNRGSFSAMECAAAIYYEGKDVPVDRAMAREWIEKLRRYDPNRDPKIFARKFSGSAYGEALAWITEETSVAEELDQLYEQAFFLETAKGQRQDALRLYRQIINTKASNGTHPVIAKTLRRMLVIYEDPDADPLKESIRFARDHLTKCKELHLLSGVFAIPEAHRTMKSVPELSALDDLCDIYDQAMKDVLKRDEKYRSASEKIDLGLISNAEYSDALHSARRKYENTPEYISALEAYDRYVLVRNTL
nr:hypothetical protein [Spirochaetales bacterium]